MLKYMLLLTITLNANASMFPTNPDQDCINYSKKLIKESLGTSQLDKLEESCKFNNGSFCIYEFTKGMSYLAYNNFNDVVNLAKKCQFVRPRCVGVVKKYLQQNEYQNSDAISDISTICIDTSFKCLDFECSNRMRNECDELSEIKALAPQCLR